MHCNKKIQESINALLTLYWVFFPINVLYWVIEKIVYNGTNIKILTSVIIKKRYLWFVKIKCAKLGHIVLLDAEEFPRTSVRMFTVSLKKAEWRVMKCTLKLGISLEKYEINKKSNIFRCFLYYLHNLTFMEFSDL